MADRMNRGRALLAYAAAARAAAGQSQLAGEGGGTVRLRPVWPALRELAVFASWSTGEDTASVEVWTKRTTTTRAKRIARMRWRSTRREWDVDGEAPAVVTLLETLRDDIERIVSTGEVTATFAAPAPRMVRS